MLAGRSVGAGDAMPHVDVATGADARRHVLFATWPECRDVLSDAADAAALDRRRLDAEARDGITRPRFTAQTRDLLDDGLHYETRIAERGVLATREGSAHDAFNALIWLRHPHLKWAINARQVADIERVGPKQRTRGQCALTHFDEAGAIVWLADDALLPTWDAHDWPALFCDARAAWGASMAVTVFGHALYEHVWNGHDLPVAKALAVRVPALPAQARERARVVQWPEAEHGIAARIAASALLADPQELRPLPLAGIVGWHARGGERAFVESAPCFRPLRAGRRYPPALALDLSSA